MEVARFLVLYIEVENRASAIVEDCKMDFFRNRIYAEKKDESLPRIGIANNASLSGSVVTVASWKDRLQGPRYLISLLNA